jgi:signal transduction histidine kinase
VRAATEALTNAARHAAGRPVHVSAGPTALAVTNTTGDLAAAPAPAAGRGLRLLRGRVEAAGGHLFAARDGRTWRLAVDVPPARSPVR